MTKYSTKCENTMTEVITAMALSILRKTFAFGLSVQTALKRVMVKTPGQIMLSKKQTVSLTLSSPIVLCCHVITRINLDKNQHLIKI